MFLTNTSISANRACFGSVCRIDIHNLDACFFGFVLNKVLKLAPCPAVQTGADTFACLDAFANVGEVFHSYCGTASPHRFSNNFPAHFVIYMPNMTTLPARDFLQKLFCAFGAVALESFAKIQKLVAFMGKFAAVKQFATACGGQIAFTEVNTENTACLSWLCVWNFKHQIQKPALWLFDELRLLWGALFQVRLLEVSELHFSPDSFLHREERNGIITQYEEEYYITDKEERIICRMKYMSTEPDNAAYIVAACNAVPRLVEMLRIAVSLLAAQKSAESVRRGNGY